MSIISTSILVFSQDNTFELEKVRAFSVMNIGNIDLKTGPMGSAVIPVKAGQTFTHELGPGDSHDKATWEIKFEEIGGEVILIIGIVKDVGTSSMVSNLPAAGNEKLIAINENVLLKLSELVDTLKKQHIIERII
jgi:hypothetical protein